MADVIPFYLSWIASGFLMIDRKMGKPASVIICGIMCFLEYQGRTFYGDESLK